MTFSAEMFHGLRMQGKTSGWQLHGMETFNV
jgi:hypothetical protein